MCVGPIDLLLIFYTDYSIFLVAPQQHLKTFLHKTNAIFLQGIESSKLFIPLSSPHYNDVIMSTMASQITSVSVVYSTVCSGAGQRKHQSPASQAFVGGIHRRPVNSPQKGLVTRKMFPCDDVVMPVLAMYWDAILVCQCVSWVNASFPRCCMGIKLSLV